jgi:hypothetical protein
LFDDPIKPNFQSKLILIFGS